MNIHQLPALPYPKNALEPHISAETLEYHHDKHHAAYIQKLNQLIARTRFENASLEDIVMDASGALFNNGAQVWNHTFYFNGMSPDGGGEPEGDLAAAIEETFGGFAQFKETFATKAMANFGSGWTWLVRTTDDTLEIVNTDDANNPMRDGMQPLLACDVWEHAYYIDYRNARGDYIAAFWNVVNWDFVAHNLETAAAEAQAS